MNIAGPSDKPAGFDAVLKRRTATSVGWSVARILSDQVFSFLIFVVLARLLSQAEIGIFALAYAFSEIGRIVASAGVNQLIARARTLDQQWLSTVFWSNLILASLYGLVVVAGAGLISAFYDIAELQEVLRVLALAVVLNAAGSTHMALRLREFGHRTVAIRSIVAGLVGGSVALAAAFSGFGVWALVLQRLAREIVTTALAWYSYRWIPSLRLSPRSALENLGFGGNLAFAQLVGLMGARIQDLMIGNALGAAAVGVYRVAWRCTELFGSSAISPFSGVGLQTFAQLQGQQGGFRAAYRTMVSYCALFSFPLLIGYGVLAPWLIPLVFGPQWQKAGLLGPVLAFMAVPFVLSSLAVAALSANGKVAEQRRFALVNLVSTFLVTLVALPYGLWWTAAAYVARTNLVLPLLMRDLRLTAGVTAGDSLRALWPATAASVIMAISLLGVLRFWVPGNLVDLFLLIGLGAVVYLASAALLAPVQRRQIWSQLRTTVARAR